MLEQSFTAFDHDNYNIWIKEEMIEFSLVVVHVVNTKMVKFSHTRYRALRPELIPVYRQSGDVK